MTTTTKKFKRGAAVLFSSRPGQPRFRGTVKNVIESLRGLWYEVQLDGYKGTDGRYKVRAAQLKAV